MVKIDVYTQHIFGIITILISMNNNNNLIAKDRIKVSNSFLVVWLAYCNIVNGYYKKYMINSKISKIKVINRNINSNKNKVNKYNQILLDYSTV
jgi:hypothetical protein